MNYRTRAFITAGIVAAALTAAVSLHAQTTVPVPPPNCTAVITCTQGNITIPAGTPPAPTPTPIPTPTGIAWGYQNGVRYWASDFTQGGTTVNYNNATSSGLSGHTQDILFTSTAPYGLFLPYFASDFNYVNNHYTKLLISLKPQYSGQAFTVYMIRVGDVDPGCHKNLASYGPATVAGKWGSYVIPLTDMCTASDASLYKLGLQDQTSTSSASAPTRWEMDNLGFQQ